MRKVLGGSMRQTGILAAACLYALSKAKETLTADHKNAKRLAQGIHDGLDKTTRELISVDVENTETNIVHLNILPKKLNAGVFIERFASVIRRFRGLNIAL